MTQAEEIAFVQGVEAQRAGKPKCDNPYKDPGLMKAWNDGWLAQLEQERYF